MTGHPAPPSSAPRLYRLQVRQDAGLFTLQQAALILGHLWALGDLGLRKRVLGVLHQKGETLGTIRCAWPLLQGQGTDLPCTQSFG